MRLQSATLNPHSRITRTKTYTDLTRANLVPEAGPRARRCTPSLKWLSDLDQLTLPPRPSQISSESSTHLLKKKIKQSKSKMPTIQCSLPRRMPIEFSPQGLEEQLSCSKGRNSDLKTGPHTQESPRHSRLTKTVVPEMTRLRCFTAAHYQTLETTLVSIRAPKT